MVKKFFLFEILLIFLFIIKTAISSDCLNENNNTGLLLSTCTRNSYNNINNYNNDTNNTNFTLDCCLLKIEQDSHDDITKCIEILNDEDEIERRITAFQAMYKDAIISIDCKSNFISINLLIIFICLLL